MTQVTLDQQIGPLIEAAECFDVRTSNAGCAIYLPRGDGIEIYCTPFDHPGGLWTNVSQKENTFQSDHLAQPAAYVGKVRWIKAEDGNLVGLELKTEARALAEHYELEEEDITNRKPEIGWAKLKLQWLWQASIAQGTMPDIAVNL